MVPPGLDRPSIRSEGVPKAKRIPVKIDRHQARILALQLLAQLDVQGEGFWHEAESFLSQADAGQTEQARAAELVRRCWASRGELDERILAAAEHWSVHRMSLVDRNVLRLALAELAEGQVPPRVVIDEAIEISREYGSAESARFVNGVLDAIWKRQERDTD